ncbi:endonuclease domain-containing protein [Magnetospirillum sp. UT-4]|uniref:endonuclease domain-containing protein n=1 Tax=Magnetospirillum sp. UT-4 TaxID=2681467 RepID=UPI0020C53045|nr:endonuclease domain-containing protein [Magnetospirillum sp. UT-4]
MSARDYARQMRKLPTEAERRLWQLLRLRQLGVKFRRQVPLGPYIADFACFEHRLVIEADGGQHAESADDRQRDAWFAENGYRVLRFWNNDIMENPEGVLMRIAEALASSPPPQPSPARGEGV